MRRLAAVASWRQESVRDVATPLSQSTLAAPDELLNSVLERLGAGGGLPILVMDDGRLGGIVTAHDIDCLFRWHTTGSARGGAPAAGGVGRPGIDA
ncbi:hypothetical protein [Streptomyces sp. NPDC001820]|uniref:hypothetical protein n=1 Tax=Streptomyces sp. NPDC001820 TaxID=3364613 RepID=UPI00368EC813